MLFREGDTADCFYILLKGKLDVLRNSQNSISLTAEDYLLALIELNRKGQKENINKTLNANLEIYPVFKSDLNNLENIIIFLKYKKLMKTNSAIEKFKILFKKYNVKAIDIHIHFYSSEGREDKNDILKIVLNHLRSKCGNEFNYKNYKYLYKEVENLIIIHDIDNLVTFTSGKIFGDLALDNRNKLR